MMSQTPEEKIADTLGRLRALDAGVVYAHEAAWQKLDKRMAGDGKRRAVLVGVVALAAILLLCIWLLPVPERPQTIPAAGAPQKHNYTLVSQIAASVDVPPAAQQESSPTLEKGNMLAPKDNAPIVATLPQKDVAVTAAQQLPALDTNRHNWAAATANNDLTTMVVTVAPPRSTASQIANLPIVNENELHPEVEANELHAAGRNHLSLRFLGRSPADSNDAGGLLTVYFMRRQ